ncbi:MAG TPA: hypothetical protein VLG11_01105 [Candidatus Saccharimonadales bacterium]|nr:hypothetical protein [Candidatus Saccharimonadales bacterium]
MPTLVASYFAASSTAGDSTSLATTAFTPANGEVIVVKATTWDTGTASGTPSGGGLTYTRQATAAPGGFNGYVTIFTTVVSGSPGSMTVTLSPPAASSYHAMVVERWSNAQLAATPAVSSPITGNSTDALATITTTAANSIVTWADVDETSQNPDPGTGGGHTYRSGAIEDGLADGHQSSASVQYFAYQTAASAGSQTIGLLTPTAQKWTMIGIEVQDASGGGPSTPPGAAFMSFFR